MEHLWQDLRYGARMLIKNPGFSVVAVIALALGIGANTAIFSVVNTVLLRPLPYQEPDRLMAVRSYNVPKHPDFAVSPGDFLDWQKQSQLFQGLAAYRTSSYNLLIGSEPERIRAARVTAGLITMLGINPLHGRDFMAEEDQENSGRVAIISYGLWQRRFAADPGVLGQAMTLNANLYTIIGVMPPGFKFPQSDIDIWTPMAFDADDRQSHGAHFISVLGRLNPGVTVAQAQSEMDAIAAHLREQYADTNTGWYIHVVPMLDFAVAKIKPALLVLLGAVAFVLLIACANVANLLLARAAARQKEIAIRTAMGARRWRIVRQLLTESVLLALVGGVLGVLLAVWGIDALLALAPENLPRIKDVAIDRYALLFTFAVTIITGVAFGLVPALQASKPNLNETLKDTGRGTTGGRRRQMVRSVLVVVEVALALVLLVGGGLMLRSFARLMQVDPGFNPTHVLTVNVTLPGKKYPQEPQQAAFYKQLVDNLGTLPGVQAVSGANTLIIVSDFVLGFSVQGRPPANPGEMTVTNYYAVTPDYFKAMDIQLLRGRVFAEADNADAQRVALINETMAKRYFPDEDPIGKYISVTNGPETWRQIVGVVADVKQSGLDQETPAQTYEPFWQAPGTFMTLIVRSDSTPAALSAAIRSEVLKLDKEQPISNVKTMEQVLADSVAQQRFSMLLLAVFAVVALTLAAVGLYGVMAYSVTQRTHELGIRMALGASSRDVLRLVMGQSLLLTMIGVAIGLVAAFFLTQLMASLLFGVTATDPLTFAGIAVLQMLVALAASFVPARRALKVDPMIALRYE
jgi:putative ABC transport system permease protein